jgi:predicted nicotinamide N-methyase
MRGVNPFDIKNTLQTRLLRMSAEEFRISQVVADLCFETGFSTKKIMEMLNQLVAKGKGIIQGDKWKPDKRW